MPRRSPPPTRSRSYYRSLTDLYCLTPQEFEEYVSFLLQELGYRTQRRGWFGDPDGGVDIDAWRDGQYVIVQCKRYGRGKEVGNQYVLHLVGAVEVEKADKGFLVTTGNFTRAAVSKAIGTKVELIGPSVLAAWQKEAKVVPYLPMARPVPADSCPGPVVLQSVQPNPWVDPGIRRVSNLRPGPGFKPISKPRLSVFQILLVFSLVSLFLCTCVSPILFSLFQVLVQPH